MQTQRRHQGDTKAFEELTRGEQAKSISIHALWFLDATRNHMRKGGSNEKVARQLESMAAQVRALQSTGPVVPIEIVK